MVHLIDHKGANKRNALLEFTYILSYMKKRNPKLLQGRGNQLLSSLKLFK